MPPKLSDEEQNLLIKLVKDYFTVKKLIIEAENLDKEKRIPINAINELRNALDHLMRVFAVNYGLYEKNINIRQNLEEALEHIYRAGYDACDIIAITLLEEIERLLEPYPVDVILKVWTDFYDKWFPKLAEAKKAIEEAKIVKGNWDGFNADYFHSYLKKVEALENLLEELRKRITAVQRAYEEEIKRKEEARRWNRRLVIATASGALGAIIGGAISAVLTYLLMK